jgi:hypothetical protein
MVAVRMLTLVALWRLKKPSPEMEAIHARNVAILPSLSLRRRDVRNTPTR